jgi:HEAT repeat protein
MRRLFLVFLVFASFNCAAQCPVELGEGRRDFDDQEYRASRIALARNVISATTSRNDGACFAAAAQYLGKFRVEAAIPDLIRLITLERKFDHPDRMLTIADKYPAVAGLLGMGEAAVPSLLDVLASQETTSLASRNALEALMSINSGHEGDVLAALSSFLSNEKDVIRAQRLTYALSTVRSDWCRRPFSTCEKVGSGSR